MQNQSVKSLLSPTNVNAWFKMTVLLFVVVVGMWTIEVSICPLKWHLLIGPIALAAASLGIVVRRGVLIRVERPSEWAIWDKLLLFMHQAGGLASLLAIFLAPSGTSGAR